MSVVREKGVRGEAPVRKEVGEEALLRFGEAWDEFFGAVRRAKGRAAREAGGRELTLSQYQLLAALGELPERPVGELAEAVGVAPPTATRMVDCLERAGIVERRNSTEDRRVVTVRLTPHGGRLLRRKRELVTGKRRALWLSLTPEEREQAEHLLRRLAAIVEEL
jgi:MarR family transcriptional regulator, organic hydroperoxide resistance regulator